MQIGQQSLSETHSSAQSLWKAWPQGRTLSGSVVSKGPMQTAQRESSRIRCRPPSVVLSTEFSASAASQVRERSERKTRLECFLHFCEYVSRQP